MTLVLRRLHLWLPPLLYMAVIFYFSSQSKPLPEMTVHVWDKALHAVEYGVLAILVCRAFVGDGVNGARAALFAAIVACLYAASDEWHQSFVPMRSADVLDWIADTVGSILGAAVPVFAALLKRPLNRQRFPRASGNTRYF